jgi:hypothetical protein
VATADEVAMIAAEIDRIQTLWLTEQPCGLKGLQVFGIFPSFTAAPASSALASRDSWVRI